jgi:hypothetical protein
VVRAATVFLVASNSVSSLNGSAFTTTRSSARNTAIAAEVSKSLTSPASTPDGPVSHQPALVHNATLAGKKAEVHHTQLFSVVPSVESAVNVHETYVTHLGPDYQSDIELTIMLRGRLERMTVEVKSQTTSGSAIEKIYERLGRLQAVRITYDRPVVMTLFMRGQRAKQMTDIERKAASYGVALLYQEEISEDNVLRVLDDQLRIIGCQIKAREMNLVATPDICRLTGQYHLAYQVCEFCEVTRQLIVHQHGLEYEGRCESIKNVCTTPRRTRS